MRRARKMSPKDLLPNERRALEAEKAHLETLAEEASAWSRAERNYGNDAKADSLADSASKFVRQAMLIGERLA